MTWPKNKILNWTILIVVLVGVSLAFYSACCFSEMSGTHNFQDIAGCSGVGSYVSCLGNLSQHIFTWQRAQVFLVENSANFLLPYILALIFLFSIFLIDLANPHIQRINFFRKRNFLPAAFYLQNIFSKGILNPKTF